MRQKRSVWSREMAWFLAAASGGHALERSRHGAVMPFDDWSQVNQVKAKLARIRRQIEAASTADDAGGNKPVVNGAVGEVELI